MTGAEKRAIQRDRTYVYKKEPVRLSSILNKIGGPRNIWLGIGLLSLLPSYIAMRLLKQDHAIWKSLGISTALGLGGGLASTPIRPKRGYTYGENVLGKRAPKYVEDIDNIIDNLPSKRTFDGYDTKLGSDNYFLKEASAFLADLPNTSKLTLHDLVNTTPGFTPPQRDFLHNGIYNAPAKNPNIVDLANGFVSTVNTVTGGLLPTASRAIEGALIGSAFSGVMGAQPGTKKFVAGATAMANSLWGNNLFNTIPQVY